MEEKLPVTRPEAASLPQNHYHTIIVGTGPIGLLSALSALKHCEPPEKIAVMADRIEELGIRQQVLIINRDVFDFMEAMVGVDLMNRYISEAAITEDPHSPNPLKKNHFITTGDMERLFYDALGQQYTQGTQYDLIETKKVSSPNPSETIDYTKEIKVDTEHNILCMRGKNCNGQPYTDGGLNVSLHFNYLVSADGAKRSVAKSLGDDVVAFVHNQQKLYHPKHVVATFKIPEDSSVHEFLDKVAHAYDEDPEHIEDAAKLTPVSLSTLRTDYQWQSNARPYSQVYAVKDILYIGAEIPNGLSKIQARSYARDLLRDSLPQEFASKIADPTFDTSTDFGKKQSLLSTSVFDIELGELNRLVIPCGPKVDGKVENQQVDGGIFIVGDAAKQPLYTTGTGVQTGIREVMCLEKFMAAEVREKHQMSSHIDAYNDGLEALLAPMRKRQDDWVEKIKARVARAELNCSLFHKISHQFGKLDGYFQQKDREELGAHHIPEHEWVVSIQQKLKDLQDKHANLFDCIFNKISVVDYNFLKMNYFIADLKILQADIKQHMGQDAPEEIGELNQIIDVLTENNVNLYRQMLARMKDDGEVLNPSAQPKT